MKNAEKFLVRDLRHKKHFTVDDVYIDEFARFCGPNGTSVYACLCRHADFHTQSSFPSIPTMAEKLGISQSSVKRAIISLEECNIILKERVRHPESAKWVNNSYSLIDKSQWKKPQLIQSYGTIAQIEDEPQLKSAQNHSSVRPLKVSHIKVSHIKEDAEQSSAVAKPLKADSFFWKKKSEDDGISMALSDFILMCRGSAYRYIRIIGEYADDRRPNNSTRGQWREFGRRSMRAAQQLAPYTDRQLEKVMDLMQKDLKEKGGFISKWTLETMVKYLDEV